jgi:type I restriction enzyme S subunit
LTREKLVKVKCIVPPLMEQNNIVEAIEILNNKIHNTISKAKTEIAKIKEYQESLISNIVTGKIKVPEKN